MDRFANKLKAIKNRLKFWNRDIFGRVDQMVKEAEDLLMETEHAFEQDPSEANKILVCQAKRNYNEKLAIEELNWK